jgi:hypothetical protein
MIRRFIIPILLLPILFAVAQSPKAEKVAKGSTKVKMRFAKDTIMIGDQIPLEVVIEKELMTEIELPQPRQPQGKGDSKIELMSITSIDTLSRTGRDVTIMARYNVTSFEAGSHTLTGFPILAISGERRDTLYATDTLHLVVNTYDIDTVKMDIADIRSPLQTPLVWAEIKELVLYGALAAALLGVIIYFVVRYVKRKKKVKVPKVIYTPHEAAILALKSLQSEKLPERGRYKEYYSRLTDVVRIYLEARYQIGAMEMTTPQIVDALLGVNTPELTTPMRELFSEADLVKFAKMTTSPEQCDDAYNLAYRYIEDTKEEV